MKKTSLSAAGLLAAGLLFAAWLTQPQSFSDADLPAHTPDPSAGERWFWAGGCASCHATPVDGKRARDEDRLLLGGGAELDTPFGVFRVPNISSHREAGIGAWSTLDFVNAMQRGVSPDGRHYYPSFPYASYARMRAEDVMDLKAFLDTLPAVDSRNADHELKFPYSLRRGLGVWKRLYLSPEFVTEAESEKVALGRELVEGAGHCGECHTPRDSLGGSQLERWLAGAADLEGEGKVPDITASGNAVGDWSEVDLAYYFESGFTPDFDTVGGTMVAVQENLAQLSSDDREAIAAYLKRLPAANP